ncbi:MAG: hypothetical protein ACYC91_07055 [Solirubrobacteraceae bacterium]
MLLASFISERRGLYVIVGDPAAMVPGTAAVIVAPRDLAALLRRLPLLLSGRQARLHAH